MSQDDTPGDGITSSPDLRWKYLASTVTGLFLLSLACIVILAGMGILALGSITQGWFVLYSTVALMSATWLLGTDTLKAVRESRQG